MNRVTARARDGEEGISRDMLQAIHDNHEDWLVKGKFGKLPCAVICIDGSLNCAAMCEQALFVLEKMKEVILLFEIVLSFIITFRFEYFHVFAQPFLFKTYVLLFSDDFGM